MLTIVDSDEWRGLYLDGKLIHQGEDIPLKLLAKHAGISYWTADEDWLYEEKGLPLNLQDVAGGEEFIR